jgi:hypothetical protein
MVKQKSSLVALPPSANRSAAKQLNIADDFAGLRVTAERLRTQNYW